jgi:two-component system sensor histidine kinase/response regulator
MLMPIRGLPKPARILIVDDEVFQLKALSDVLARPEYEVTGFSDPDEALAALQNSKFDLLLSDLVMPKMDGITLLAKALEIDPHLMGIIITAQGTIGTAVGAMKAGAFDYILKPFEENVLLPVLSRAVAVRGLRLENADLEERIRERTLQLESANEELEAFASSVAHDLRAPARHIKEYVELLFEDCAGELSATAITHLTTIARTAERMNTLIIELLGFARISRADMRRSTVNLNTLAHSVREELMPETRDRMIHWKIAELPVVQADETMLRQVFYNLFSNALKYSRDRIPAEIEVGTVPGQGAEKIIYVRDNGVGFNMDYVDKLFGVFQRLHREDEFEGIGLGLANVRRMINRHGGRTWAEGIEKKGATFYFTLPP